MNRVWSTIQALFIVLVFFRPAVAGEVYTWTDANGNLHITDRPPADGSPVESVIRYSNPVETQAPSEPASPQDSVESQPAERLNKQLTRLKERKAQLEKSIAENRASIAAAEKDAAYYRKRSGSHARRNQESIERQLAVLHSNQTTYQSDQRYVEEDIAETERLLQSIELRKKRPAGESGATAMDEKK